jgi:hypothetical protein
MKYAIHLSGIAFFMIATLQAQSPSPAGDAIPVTPDNFNRAETDMYFGTNANEARPPQAASPSRSGTGT